MTASTGSHYRPSDHLHHDRRVAVSERFNSLAEDSHDGSVHLSGRLSIHSYSAELTRVPRSSGIGCPLSPVNLEWDRSPGARQSLETGAGKYEHAPARIWRTTVASLKLNSGTVEASSRKVASDFFRPRDDLGGLLHDKPFDAHVEPDAKHFWPQALAASSAVNSGSEACPLAWGAADDDVGLSGRADVGSNVVMLGDLRESLAKNVSAPRAKLYETGDLESTRVHEAGGMAPDAGKGVEDSHSHLRSPLRRDTTQFHEAEAKARSDG